MVFSNLEPTPDVIEQRETKTSVDEGCKLVLYDDDFHTFDFVIESLIEVCGLATQQAEQITMLVHYKGKAVVKRGGEQTLSPMCNGLCQRDLSAELQY